MDIREIKTKRAIYNAFMKMRSESTLEEIKVKSLAAEAEISKATFYLHYRDIYDLSEQLQKELIREILCCVSDPALFLTSPRQSFIELEKAFYLQKDKVIILFSGKQELRLAAILEQEIKEAVFKARPELRGDLKTNVRLSFQILGSFCSYHVNSNHFDPALVSEELIKLLDPPD
jgi:AcrR family transcriptional regulator